MFAAHTIAATLAAAQGTAAPGGSFGPDCAGKAASLPARLMTELRYSDNLDVFAGVCTLKPATDGN